MSAVFASVAVANVFYFLRLWLKATLPAAVGAITLAVSHTFWLHAAIAEVYTLYAAFFTAELILLLQFAFKQDAKYVYWLGFANGLSISTHMFGIIPAACYVVSGIFLLREKRIGIKHIGLACCLWLLGACPYLYLIVKDMAVSGEILPVLSSALFGTQHRIAVLNTLLPLRVVVENILFLVLNFPTPNLVFLFVGLFVWSKKASKERLCIVLGGILVLFYIFAFRYEVPGRYTFFLPSYIMSAILVGIGFDYCLHRIRKHAFAVAVLLCCFLPVGVYALAPLMAQKMRISIGPEAQTYRNAYRYFLQPWKTNYQEPERFAARVLDNAENGAVVLALGTTAYTLWYVQAFKNKRSDVAILSQHENYNNPIAYPSRSTIRDLMSARAVYVTSPESVFWRWEGFDANLYRFIKCDSICRLMPSMIPETGEVQHK
jgi:hypothetical protein